MKRILISLTLLLTISIASTETSHSTNVENMDILTKGQVVLREARTFRTVRKAREVRSTVRTARLNREVPESSITKIEKNQTLRVNREVRENRKMRQLLIQDNVHFARLK